MMDHNETEPEELDLKQSSALLSDKGSKEIPDIPFCGCLSVRYYQPYFDVDTEDVKSRISHAFVFCKREQNFMTMIGERPDLYGPFWIATTLVFTVAVASHLNGWLTSWMTGDIWEYDFQAVISASSVIYGFAAFAPLIIWFIYKQYDQTLKFVTVVCLYGYSLLPFIPAVLMCLFPSELACWLSLISAAVASALFLLRNVAPIVMSNARQQAALLLSIVGITQFVLMLCLKLYFFYDI